MGCLCYCRCERKRLALNVIILILSTVCVIINSLMLGVRKYIEDNVVFEIVMVIINSVVTGIQSFQLHLEKHEGEKDKRNEDNC